MMVNIIVHNFLSAYVQLYLKYKQTGVKQVYTDRVRSGFQCIKPESEFGPVRIAMTNRNGIYAPMPFYQTIE